MRKIRRIFWNVFGVKNFYYEYDERGMCESKCPVTGAGVGSIYCKYKCRRIHERGGYFWLKCPALNRWLRKNDRLTVPNVENSGK